MKRRYLILPLLSAVYWASCLNPDGQRIKGTPGWELDLRAAICGACVVLSIVLFTSIVRELFQERS